MLVGFCFNSKLLVAAHKDFREKKTKTKEEKDKDVLFTNRVVVKILLVEVVGLNVMFVVEVSIRFFLF